jgi:N-acetylmuramoyl-L-alanine amidase
MVPPFYIEWLMNNCLKIIIIYILFSIPLCSQAVSNTRITNVRAFATEDGTRIIFNFSTFKQARIFSLENPNRLVFDFNNTQLGVRLTQLNLDATNIKSIREGYPNSTILRIVVDIKTAFTFKKIVQLNPFQLVVDLYSPKNFPKKMLAKMGQEPFIAPSKVMIRPVEATAFAIKTAQTMPVNKRPFIVVVDAGHGGKDTGAIGFYKTREKDIVLAIAKQLTELINQQPNMRAVMTRKGDYFVPLANRLILTRKGDADLFIAIHADSYFNTRASGASVFALSQRGATTVAARWLSDSDNHSELDGVELNRLNDKSPLLRSVLIDLAQTVTVRDSLRFGNSVLDSLEAITRLHAAHVEQAPFMVLKSPDIPSILVETGFISNGGEELRLRDPIYQRKLALALFNGIRVYQKKYVPVGIQ